MPENNDYEPAPWAAKDTFASARATYDTHVGRSYADAVDAGVKASDLLLAKLTTDVAAPIVIISDETGSMGEWPATIFSKLGYVDHEAEFYFGKGNYAVAFGAFGDANCNPPELYPVQMRPFAVGSELAPRLKELVIEKKGGGQIKESSELAGCYVDQNIEIPNAVRPILIFITDEKAYETVNPDQAKQWCKADLHQRMSTRDLFDSLKSKWAVYVILKPYDATSEGSPETSTNQEVRLFWEGLVGKDHVLPLPDPARVVDVIFGIFGQETGKYEDFVAELKDRQLKDDGGEKKVKTVLTALSSLHRDAGTGAPKLTKDKSLKKLPAPAADGKSVKKLPPPDTKSVTRRDPGTTTKRSKSLLGDDDDSK